MKMRMETIPNGRSQKFPASHSFCCDVQKALLFLPLNGRFSEYMLLLFLVLVVCLCAQSDARKVTELHGTNFELTLTTFKYIAILFYDDTSAGRNMKNNWMLAAGDVDLPEDCDMAQVLKSSSKDRTKSTTYLSLITIYRSLVKISSCRSLLTRMILRSRLSECFEEE